MPFLSIIILSTRFAEGRRQTSPRAFKPRNEQTAM
jgi:hypothetical protein